MAAHNTVAKAAHNMVENSRSLPIFHSFVTAKFFKSSSCLCFFVERETQLLDALVLSQKISCLYSSQPYVGGRLVFDTCACPRVNWIILERWVVGCTGGSKSYIVKPPKKGQYGDGPFVLSMEVVFT